MKDLFKTPISDISSIHAGADGQEYTPAGQVQSRGQSGFE